MRCRRLAVLLSGRGSNFLAIADAIRHGRLDAEIACVLSNVEDAASLAHARALGFPALAVPPGGSTREAYDRRLLGTLAPHDPALVCLTGFMRVLGPAFVRAYAGRVVNIHPSLLPAFPGLHAQRQALEYGVKISGCTVHLVDEGVDTGPILVQRSIPVLPDDTEESLSARILVEEHEAYWRGIALLLDGGVQWQGRRALYTQD